MRIIRRFLPYFVLMFFLFADQSGSKSKGAVVKGTRSSYSWSRKTRSLQPIKGIAETSEFFDLEGKLQRSSFYTKSRKPYSATKYLYKDGKLKARRTYDDKKNLWFRASMKYDNKGAGEWIYKGSNELILFHRSLIDKEGFLREKRTFGPDKKLQQYSRYYYDDKGMLSARISFSADDKPYYLAEYLYDKLDQEGNWQQRKELQNYFGIYPQTREDIHRTLDYSGGSLTPNLKKRTMDDYDDPQLELEALYSLTETMAKIDGPGAKVLALALKKIKDKTIIKGSCYDWINMIYNECGYKGVRRLKIHYGKESGPYANPAELKPGDWVMYKNLTYGEIGHSGIFLCWIDFDARSAMIISYAGQNRTMPGRYREYDVTNLFGIYRGDK